MGSKGTREELLKLLALLEMEEGLLERGKLERYKPHAKQLAFHKSDAKVRLLIGGNRCIREDQRIVTKRGLVSIGEMRESPEEVLSYNQRSNQYEWSLSSVSFPKGKSNQYRVIHRGGEFVGDGRHQIFCFDGEYRFLEDVYHRGASLLYRDMTNLEFDQRSSFSNELNLKGTGEDLKDDYLACNYLYGQQLLFLREVSRLFFEQYICVNTLKRLGEPEIFGSRGLQVGRRLKHSHQDQLRILLKNFYEEGLVLGRNDFGVEDLVLGELLQQILEGNLFVQQFLLKIIMEKIVQLSVSAKGYTGFGCDSSNDPNSISVIESIEKLEKEEWYWDIQVPGNNNYVTEDGIIHHNSGKTTANVLECLWTALGVHPYHPISVPCRIKMYGDSFPTVMETFVPKFEEWCPKEFLDSRKPYEKNQMGHIIGVNFKNGSEIKIGSYDQENRKAEGSNWNLISFDEPPGRDLYIANMRGLIDHGGRMIFSLTPLSEPWIYDDIYVPSVKGEKEYIECFQVRSDENPHIDHNALQLFLDELTEEEKEIRFEGKFAKLTGLVIDTYNPLVHDIDEFELDDNYVVYEGIDPHPMKPHCALWKAVDKDGMRFVVDELSFQGGLADFGRELVRKRHGLTVGGARFGGSCIDTIINTTDMSNRINMKDELNRGIKEECIKLNRYDLGVIPSSAMKRDQLDPGIQKIRDLYRVVKSEQLGCDIVAQRVFKRCKKYKYELGHYQWPDGAHDKSKPINKNDDFIACERYLESLAPHYHTPGSNFIRNNADGYRRLKKIERGFEYGAR